MAIFTVLPLWGPVPRKPVPEVLAALVGGCQKVQGQQGYYRAIAGMRTASRSAFERAPRSCPTLRSIYFAVPNCASLSTCRAFHSNP